MSEDGPSIEKLKKQLRVFERKLERSEWHRVDLENQHDRDQHLYRRLHTDLEAAHREVEIESALERVRTRAMAMHTSDDLSDAAAVVFAELERLGVSTLRCGINIIHESGQMDLWTATATEGEADLRVLGRLDKTMHPMLEAVYEAWKAQQQHFTYALAGEDMEAYYRALKHAPAYPFPEDANPTGSHFANLFIFSEGGLYAFAEQPLAEESIQIFQRFAAVFGLTYRRYLDLKQAEEQARVAERQAALDRVRAEIASMRTTADLERITPLIWRELTTLGVPFFRCGVFIIDEATETVQMFLTTPEGKALAALPLGFNDAPIVTGTVTHWRQAAVYRETWDAAQMQAWTTFLQGRGLIENATRYLDAEAPPEHLALHFVPFTQGMLYVGSKEALDDEATESIQALADAFAVAYTRYEDFQRLETKHQEVEAALRELKTTQQQLVHAEKMASLGALTAGIAHEIKNPLNFVNNFSSLSSSLLDELRDWIEAHGGMDEPEIRELVETLTINAAKINEHGRRADGIVRSMMQHARGSEGRREVIDINTVVNEYVDLAFHGKRAHVPAFNAEIEKNLGAGVGRVSVVPQEIGRVLLNLIGNAFDAVYEHGTRVNGAYVPTVTVSTRQVEDYIEIEIKDNGPGIPAEIREKIFEPFFTTKPTGSGTGLGLSLSYDIVTQGHGGTLVVESTEGEGAAFIVALPVGNTASDPVV